jgi:hypothetical protein
MWLSTGLIASTALAFVFEVQGTEWVPLWSKHSWRLLSQTGYSCSKSRCTGQVA